MFRTIPLSIIGVFHCTHSTGICHTGFADSLRAGSERPSSSCSQAVSKTCMTYTIAVCTVKNSYDGQRNCPKHVEFYSKNKFEMLVHLVSFTIGMYHDARSSERQNL